MKAFLFFLIDLTDLKLDPNHKFLLLFFLYFFYGAPLEMIGYFISSSKTQSYLIFI